MKTYKSGFVTKTNPELNSYYDSVFRPKFLELENFQSKEYRINGGRIVCESKNTVLSDGWKLSSLKLSGEVTYTLRVYSDEGSFLADCVESYTDKETANNRFLFWKQQLSV